jgi:hypothetical protein
MNFTGTNRRAKFTMFDPMSAMVLRYRAKRYKARQNFYRTQTTTNNFFNP